MEILWWLDEKILVKNNITFLDTFIASTRLTYYLAITYLYALGVRTILMLLHNLRARETSSTFKLPVTDKTLGPTWGLPGSCRPQVGPMLAPWAWLSGKSWILEVTNKF